MENIKIKTDEFNPCCKCGSTNMLHTCIDLDNHSMYCLEWYHTVNDRDYYECLAKWNNIKCEHRPKSLGRMIQCEKCGEILSSF